jgi:hypothetical protein
MLDESIEPRPAGVSSAVDLAHDIAGGSGRGDVNDVELVAVAGALEGDSPFDYLGKILGHGDGGGGRVRAMRVWTGSCTIGESDDGRIYRSYTTQPKTLRQVGYKRKVVWRVAIGGCAVEIIQNPKFKIQNHDVHGIAW